MYSVSDWKGFMCWVYFEAFVSQTFQCVKDNVPQSLANQLHLWIWHRYGLASKCIPRTLFLLQQSVPINPLMFVLLCFSQYGSPLSPLSHLIPLFLSFSLPLLKLPPLRAVFIYPLVLLWFCLLSGSRRLNSYLVHIHINHHT